MVLTNQGISVVVLFSNQSCRGMTHLLQFILNHSVKKARILYLSLSWITRKMKHYRQIQQGTVKSNRHTGLESWRVFKLCFLKRRINTIFIIHKGIYWFIFIWETGLVLYLALQKILQLNTKRQIWQCPLFTASSQGWAECSKQLRHDSDLNKTKRMCIHK